MATGDVADAPSGFTSMCTREPQDCAPVGPVEDQAPVRLTQQRWALVQHVNRDANTRIRPLSDELNYGVPERWVDPLAGHLQDSRYTAAGDCEDFALAKRDLLLAAGWPAGAMFVAVGYHMTLGPHAVLVVRTDRGDLVLDSRTPWISAWTDTPYYWVKRQVAADSTTWVQAYAPPRGLMSASLQTAAPNS